jgi:hypothetical protein
MLTCFGMIWDCDIFKDETKHLAKSIHFQTIKFIQNWFFLNDILGQL